MRFAFLVFEAAFGLYLILVIVTQIIIPLIKGTKLFPYIRYEGKLTGEEVNLATELDRELQSERIQELRDTLAARKENKDGPDVAA